MKHTYSTSQTAEIIGIHPNTVRLYEELGLITPPERKSNGYRIFTDLHIRQFRIARLAFQVEVLQNGLRKQAVDIIKTAAQCDFSGAIALSEKYPHLYGRGYPAAENHSIPSLCRLFPDRHSAHAPDPDCKSCRRYPDGH